jgi:hypothetical protein
MELIIPILVVIMAIGFIWWVAVFFKKIRDIFDDSEGKGIHMD